MWLLPQIERVCKDEAYQASIFLLFIHHNFSCASEWLRWSDASLNRTFFTVIVDIIGIVTIVRKTAES